MVQGHILVVDDDAINRLFLRSVLNLSGYVVEEASSAERAIEMLAEGQSFDMVLSDYVMPGMDGLAFLDYVSRHYTHVPVILHSSYAADIADLAKALGAVDCIAKPFHLPSLVAMIKRWAEPKQAALYAVS